MGREVPGLVVVFTDASYQMATCSAGWGAWAIGERAPRGLFASGPIKTAITNTEAEIMAIACALQRFANHGIFDDQSKVMIKSDCARALQACMAWGGAVQSAKEWEFKPLHQDSRITEGEGRAIEVIRRVLDSYRLDFIVRHVKGHHAFGDGSHRVNDQCDRLAKQEQHKMHRHRTRAGFTHPTAPGANRVPGPGKRKRVRHRRRNKETAHAGQ